MHADVSVIKVGGSLLDWPDLPDRLSVFLKGQRTEVASGHRVLLAGGGPAVDLVRRLDRDHHLGGETAHRLAIHAMDLTARCLVAILPGSVAVDRLGELFPVWSSGRIPVLTPSPILQDIERPGMAPLPRTWDMTSDSIAAWIADHLGAKSLILLKSASLPIGADREMAARLERVTHSFPSSLEPFRMWSISTFATRTASFSLCNERMRGSENLTISFTSVRIPIAAIWLERTTTMAKPARGERCPSPGCCLLTSPTSHLWRFPRLRGQLVYFMTPPGSAGVPLLGENEYWLARDEVVRWLTEGVFYLVSPLDSANATEVELTEEQESLLTWLDKHGIQHVRLVE